MGYYKVPPRATVGDTIRGILRVWGSDSRVPFKGSC